MTDAPTTPDPIEIAMEAEASGRAPGGVAHELLRRQSALVGWQVASERARAAVRAMTFLAMLLALAAAGLFVWSAAKADGVVIGAFETPPGLAQRGLTGTVVAAQVLDRLRAMQAETQTLRAVATLGSGWGGGVRVAIPNTGVSIGDLRQYLVDWLGRETRVSGELFETPDGRISVATRVGVRPGSTVSGPPSDLPLLLNGSAEAIYGQTQPYLYSRWLAQNGRTAEADAILQRLLLSSDRTERLWSLYSLIQAAPTTDEKWRYIAAAQALDPDFAPVMMSAAFTLHDEGREQAARDAFRRSIARAAQLRRQVNADEADSRLAIQRAFEASYSMDYASGARWARHVIDTRGQRGGSREAAMYTARHLSQLHDAAGARAVLDQAGLDDDGVAQLARRTGPNGDPRLYRALAVEDWPRAADELAPAEASEGPQTRVLHSLALARAGRTDEALAAADALPPASTAHAYGRAFVLSLAGRGAEADRWFAEAVRRGPELPLAHCLWAEALLRRGDLEGALREAGIAGRLGPKSPEPPRLKGDALMRLARPGEAAKAYAAAAKLSPNWGGLRVAWAEALAKAGRAQAAREQWRIAASLDLSAADRARLAQVMQ